MATFKVLSSISTNNRITVLNILRRRMSSDSLLKDPIQSEVNIPVPWGHIAGLLYHLLFFKSSFYVKTENDTHALLFWDFFI